MASKAKMAPLKVEVLEKEGPETRPDRPLLDLSDAAIKKLIRSARKHGYVTHVQINELLSSEEVKSEQPFFGQLFGRASARLYTPMLVCRR